ncbi:MAG: hypothetical protein AABY04_00610, partial [Candidatus Micrarchaeota archaeon]
MPPSTQRPSIKREKEKGIATVESLYKEEESVAEIDTTNKYQTFKSATRFFAKRFASYGRGQKFTGEQAEVFAFLDLDVSAEDFYAASRGLFLFSIAIGISLLAVVYYFLSETLGLYNTLLMGLVFLFIPMAIALFYQKYPKMAADKEKLLALAYVPEIVNYLVMSMRLNPNLERAVEFAANHGRGRISDELKKIIWLVQIGKFSSVEEALDDLAYRWGPYSEDF